MKVLALGGCGQEGTTTVKDLAKSKEVSKLVIADINVNKAKKLQAEIGSKKVSTLHLDVNDEGALMKAMKDAAVVVNFVGPYYKYGVKVLKAAIAAKKNYLDINDDYDSTRDVLALHAAAKEAGITALVGMGASPGLLNILAKYGADKLDHTDEIHIRWNVSVTDVEDPEASSVLYHVLHMINGTVPQYVNGKLVDVPGLSGTEMVEFAGIGTKEAYYVGHPEPVTIPRYVKGVKTVTCKGGITGLDGVLRALRDFGLTSDTPIDMKGTKINPRETAMALLETLPPPQPLPPAKSGAKVLVKGKRGKAMVRYTYNLLKPLKMSPVTGIPASVGALMVGRNEIQAQGVFAPEACIDPGPFLTEVTKQGIVIQEVEEIIRNL